MLAAKYAKLNIATAIEIDQNAQPMEYHPSKRSS